MEPSRICKEVLEQKVYSSRSAVIIELSIELSIEVLIEESIELLVERNSSERSNSMRIY